jgi:hypothetical protein
MHADFNFIFFLLPLVSILKKIYFLSKIKQ